MIEAEDTLELKYLVSGTVIVPRPKGWDLFSEKERKAYARRSLGNRTDAELVQGLKDTALGKDNIFESVPDVSAIVDPKDEGFKYSMLSQLWYVFAFEPEGSNDMVNADKLEVPL